MILRDCLLKEGLISLAPKQGMQITYEHGEVKSQTLINKKGKRETSKIAYKKDSFLLDTISTYEQEQNNPESLTTTVKRHYDDAQRCRRAVNATPTSMPA